MYLLIKSSWKLFDETNVELGNCKYGDWMKIGLQNKDWLVANAEKIHTKQGFFRRLSSVPFKDM